MQQIAPGKFLGKLCVRGHDYQGTGKSLRYCKGDHFCVECGHYHTKKWSVANKDKHNALRRAWRKKNPIRNTVMAVKARCNRLGIPFDLDIEYLTKLWDNQDGKCHWLGAPMCFDLPRYHPLKATIDRITPDEGYIRDNVVWACSFANIGRSNFPAGEFTALLPQLGFKGSD